MNENLTVTSDRVPFVAVANDEICRINADGTATYQWDRIEAAAQRWKPGCVDIAVCLSKVLLPLRPRRETEQEPVAYLYHDAQSAHDAHPLVHSTLLVMAIDRRPECRNETPLYTHPPRREWRSLSEEEIQTIVNKVATGTYQTSDTFARAVIARAEGDARAKEQRDGVKGPVVRCGGQQLARRKA